MKGTREGRSEVTMDRRNVKRAITGGFIGLSIGFLIALLISGFRITEALTATLWCLPFTAGLTYIHMREKPGPP